MNDLNLLEAYLATEIFFFASDGKRYKTASVADAGSQMVNESNLLEMLGRDVVDLWVITAFNPRSVELDPKTNKTYNAALAADLSREGIEFNEVHCASPSEPWSEDSFMVICRDQAVAETVAATVQKLALKYEQNAVFRITADEQQIVPILQLRIMGGRKYRLVESPIFG